VVADRMLVTNDHVVRNGNPKSMVVQCPDGSSHSVATVVAIDDVTDLAVLKLQSSVSATSLKIDPAQIPVGAQVYALGFPLAYNGPAPLMIVGYVEGFEARVVEPGAADQQRVVLNAALNPGNSGGRCSIGRNRRCGELLSVGKQSPAR